MDGGSVRYPPLSLFYPNPASVSAMSGRPSLLIRNSLTDIGEFQAVPLSEFSRTGDVLPAYQTENAAYTQ